MTCNEIGTLLAGASAGATICMLVTAAGSGIDAALPSAFFALGIGVATVAANTSAGDIFAEA